MLNFQCHQPNGTTMERTLNLALLLGHPIDGTNMKRVKIFFK